jgi:hypothetical protein
MKRVLAVSATLAMVGATLAHWPLNASAATVLAARMDVARALGERARKASARSTPLG